jgi:hypothetical protein
MHAQKVDCSGRCSTPAGIAGKLRPHRAKARGGSTHAPRKASTTRCNQPLLVFSKATKFTKTAIINDGTKQRIRTFNRKKALQRGTNLLIQRLTILARWKSINILNHKKIILFQGELCLIQIFNNKNFGPRNTAQNSRCSLPIC